MYKIALVFLLLITPAFAQTKPEFIEVVPPKFISPNIVFVIDGSSTIYQSSGLNAKFNLAFKSIINKMAIDEWYFSIYLFSDKDEEKFYPWREANHKEFGAAHSWILDNRGIYSYGNKALSLAIKEKNPLNKNKAMQRTLTVVLITDGGFTEATLPSRYNESFKLVDDSQKWREKKELFKATILTIGLENKVFWSDAVKRPDNECQKFLKDLGQKYNGGYFLVRNKK